MNVKESDGLRELREAAGLDKSALARLVGVSRQAITAYEKGAMQPTLPVASRIAVALGVSIDELFRQWPDAPAGVPGGGRAA